jgi:hypothetical protein
MEGESMFHVEHRGETEKHPHDIAFPMEVAKPVPAGKPDECQDEAVRVLGVSDPSLLHRSIERVRFRAPRADR